MIFPSYVFLLIFLPVVLAAWHSRLPLRVRLLILTGASYVFYGWWDYRFVSLLVASSVLDFTCGRGIHGARSVSARKAWLVASLAGNLGLLGFFKYWDFFTTSVAAVLEGVGLQANLPLLEVVLPVGISFYTFQSMSYSIDIFQGRCRPVADFWRFAAYVSLFPQLVAGPIVRYRDVEDQLAALEDGTVVPGRLADGIWLLVLGLAKKIWIADRLGPVADHYFDGAEQLGFLGAWVGALCYTFQLYFDFSGYSDMARGLGKLLGFDFPINFSSPYQAVNPSDFWRRWHVSLSNWLRDYLYIPLGGSRLGRSRTVRNLMLTMLLGGLWHGAAWTFVAWGLYHGLLLVGHALFAGVVRRPLPKVVSVPATFMAVVFGWVLFRATSFDRAFEVAGAMLGLQGIDPLSYRHHSGLLMPASFEPLVASGIGVRPLAWLPIAGLLAFFAPSSEELPRPRGLGWSLVLAGAYLYTLTLLMKPTPFLYFQF